MGWLDSVFWWVGGAVCGIVAGMAGVVLLMALKEAVLSAAHVIKFYSWGVIWKPALPFQMFWYFFWHAPRYVVRKEPFAIVYRPFAKRLPGDEYNE